MGNRKSLLELGTYTYEIQHDGPELKAGETITIRRMSDEERTAFVRKRLVLLLNQLTSASDQLYTSLASDDVERLHRESLKLAKALVLEKADRRKVLCLDDCANLEDLVSFISRIIQVELALEGGQEVPEQVKLTDPAAVDGLTDTQVAQELEEAQGLGEGSAPSEPPTTIPLTGSPAETSSNSPEPYSSGSGSGG